MTPKTRRRLRIVLLLGVAVLLPACMLLPDFLGQFNAGKYDPVPGAQSPNAIADTPVAEMQTEPHTCGLHAMRSMYTAYGLSIELLDLRFRLGTDQPAMRSDKDSTGTLHPDLYRVLAQDGFEATPLDLNDKGAADDLQAHLNQQQLALAVVYRGTYHWVLLGPSELGDLVLIYDSLKADPLADPADVFISDALSITLIQPAEPGDAVSTTDAHAEGLAEMARLYKRKK